VLSVLALMLFAQVAEAVVLRVVTVETANVDAYASEIAKAKPMLQRLGIATEARVWKARFAGSDAGAVVVSLEFADLEALAKAEAKMATDAEYSAWLAGLAKMRKVVSESIYYEVTK
jgi:hypothetical protein